MGPTVLLNTNQTEQVFDIRSSDVKTFQLDWGRRLACNPNDPADTIAASAFDPEGVTIVSDHFTDRATVLTVSAAAATVGNRYPVVNHVTTADGQNDNYTIFFRIKEAA